MNDQRILRGSIITAIFWGGPGGQRGIEHLVVSSVTYGVDIIARLEPNTGKVYRYLFKHENIIWIRGEHAPDSEEVAALQVAHALAY